MNPLDNSQPLIEHLTALVGFDSRNPPRSMTTDSAIFSYLQQHLSGFNFTFFDAGDGCISLLAKRGRPEFLFNFHIDTVPTAQGWSSDPFELLVTEVNGETIITGLGACDIKGASACMLSAVAKTTGDVALLFSSDEEHGSSAAIKYFLQTDHGFTQVIVSEPTQVKAVLAHRGIQSAKILFSGLSGHASEARAINDSAIHKAGKWMAASLKWVTEQTAIVDELSGLPFNVGKIEGGIKANMIAASCEVAFGFRPLPGQDAKAMLSELEQLASSINNIPLGETIVTDSFSGPTLPSADQDFQKAINSATRLAQDHQLPIGNAVDFWTEASLFSEAGLTAIVFGPGNIAQAHTADEWVSLEQLQQVEQYYQQIIDKITPTRNFS